MRILFLAAAALSLAACGTLGITQNPNGTETIQTVNGNPLPIPITIIPPDKFATEICPTAQTVIGVLDVAVIDPVTVAKLNVATKVVQSACSIGSAVTATDLAAMNQQALPAVLEALTASNLSDADKARYAQILIAGNLAIGTALQAAQPVVVAPAKP